MEPLTTIVLAGTDISDSVKQSLEEIGRVNFIDPLTPEKSHGDVLFVGLVHQIDRTLIDKLPELRAVVTVTTGLQHVDVALCEERGIEVLSLRNASQKIQKVTSTTEHTLGLVFALLRNTVRAHSAVVVENRWERLDFVGRQISNMTVGIIGMGRIGSGVATCLSALGAEIVWCDPKARTDMALGSRLETMGEVLNRSDLVLVHVSADATPKLIDSDCLDKMKPGSYLINTSRGHLIDEEALAEAIQTGKLAGCAVDVLAGEHSPEWTPWESPLVKLARDGYNVLVTPHLGGCTSDAMNFTGLTMVDVLQEWWESRAPE